MSQKALGPPRMQKCQYRHFSDVMQECAASECRITQWLIYRILEKHKFMTRLREKTQLSPQRYSPTWVVLSKHSKATMRISQDEQNKLLFKMCSMHAAVLGDWAFNWEPKWYLSVSFPKTVAYSYGLCWSNKVSCETGEGYNVTLSILFHHCGRRWPVSVWASTFRDQDKRRQG